MFTLTHDTPVGTLTTLVDVDGVIHAAGFTDAATLAQRLDIDVPPADDDPRSTVAAAIRGYLQGDLTAMDDVPTSQAGTDFQQQVWHALADIAPGETASYGELATRIGRPGATRAVGSACGRNLIAPFIPCHRAVRSDGSMGGYLYGLQVKNWLLRHENGEH